MPITLLHFGLLAPINHFAPKKVSNVSFIIINLWLDGNSILYALFGLPGIAHGPEHSFLGAMFLSAVVAIVGAGSKKWVYGALLGGLTHILLDMLVHADMQPMWPFKDNQFYMGWMEPLSWALLPLTIWLIVQYVSNTLGWIQAFQEAFVDCYFPRDREER